ncbi:MAG: flippase-like domain-containing protein [marine benthic group bacterium]|nr:flippase-like domain-containing protein [Candidatus Benthicola marisminoris]
MPEPIAPHSTPGFRLPAGAVRAGITVFVVATLLGFGALFLITQDLRGSIDGFRNFDLRWALPALALASMDWFGSGVRIWLLTRPLGIRLSYLKCAQIGGVSAALAYLTPSGTGGGPALLYGLVRNGVSLGRTVATNFASVIVNLTFLSLAGFAAWFFGAAGAIEDIQLPVANISAATLFEWSALGFAGVGTMVILLAAAPRLPRLVLLRVFGRTPRIRKILKVLQELHGSLIIYGRKGKLALVLAVLSNGLQFGSRFVLGWVILRGFGVDAGFWNVVTLHILLQFLLYFMPTPSGSGVGEMLAPALMSPFLEERLLVAYTAVWRFFLNYLTILLGGSFLVRWISEDAAGVSMEADSTTADPETGGGP